MKEVKEKNLVSVVIHAGKDIGSLALFLTELEAFFSQHFQSYEYVLVNNEVNRDMAKLMPPNLNGNLMIVNLSWRHNIEDAMCAGIDAAIGDYVFEFDYFIKKLNTDLLWEIYQKAVSGFDMVAAAPKVNSSQFSALFYTLLQRASYRKIGLQTELFRVVSRRMINRALGTESNFHYRKANYHGSGLSTAVILKEKNSVAEKQFSFWQQFSLASNILIYYSSIGTRLSAILSIIFLVISIFIGGYALLSYVLFKSSIQEGWTTTVLFLSLGFTGLFAILTIISKYMEVLLKSAQRKDQYAIHSIEAKSK